MSAHDSANPPASRGRPPRAELRIPATSLRGDDTRARRSSDVWRMPWSTPAWGAIVATVVYIALTCWWLTQDRSIPIYDAGDHLTLALFYHNMLAAGNILEPFTSPGIYPILGHMVGALAMFVGGVNVASPIVAENVVFVPLLALGCYQTGRLLFGSLSGMLAVLFVLGSPLLISMFHIDMLDGPLTAMVAISVWLILASEDFSRPGVAGLAGLAVGLGLNVKSQFPLFVIGLTAIVLAHGGWRNKRGFLIFCAVAFVVGAPWYIIHITELGRLVNIGGISSYTSTGTESATLSAESLLSYFWSVLDSQLLAPLLLLAAVGTVWTLLAVIHGHDKRGARFEFLAGGCAAFVAITLVPHHDIRYGLPLLAFSSVIGTGWIVSLPRTASFALGTLLIVVVVANTLGITFGVGDDVSVTLPVKLAGNNQVAVYSTTGFLVSAPSRDGDLPGLLEALRREGVRTVTWSIEQSRAPDFSLEGLAPLSLFAKLNWGATPKPEFTRSARVATLIHEPVRADGPPTCRRLSDGTGVWIVRYDAPAAKLALYCPSRHPQFYDASVVG
jgi:4-amino-4-deoxy-L-arabinose transferase-like glycosyltransferase